METKQINLSNLTVKEFRDFVGNKIATAVFYKLPKTPEEIAAGRGELRVMNFRLGVAKYVKGTQPEATAKRHGTNTERMQVGVYEMKGTSTEIEAKNYRTIAIDDRLVSLAANGIKLVNEVAK